jgi:hypothetical protein
MEVAKDSVSDDGGIERGVLRNLFGSVGADEGSCWNRHIHHQELEISAAPDRVEIRVFPGPSDISPVGSHSPSQVVHRRVGRGPGLVGCQAGAGRGGDAGQQGLGASVLYQLFSKSRQ